MRYATWIINFNDDSKYGTTPETEIKLLGGSAYGALMVESRKVLGYITDDFTLSEDIATKWQIIFLSQNDALALARTINSNIFIASDGSLQSPATEI